MKNTIILTIDEVNDAIKEYLSSRGIDIKIGTNFKAILNENTDEFEGYKIESDIDFNPKQTKPFSSSQFR